MSGQISINPLLEKDLEAADIITRTAFGTFHQMPEPGTYMGNANVVCTRYRANPDWAFGAHVSGRLAGSIICARWGSFAYFGPLAVHPDFWGNGIAKKLIKPVLALFKRWQVPLVGLFTFGHSVKHLSLYHGLGFRARGLTLILGKPLSEDSRNPPDFTCFSCLDDPERSRALLECSQLTGDIFTGLDVTHEIMSIFHQNLGDTLLVYENRRLSGFAACHTGPGTEAGSSTCYIKFAAAAAGPDCEKNFNALLETCAAWAREKNAQKLLAGINVERQNAYDILIDKNFTVMRAGVAMMKPNLPGFNRPTAFIIDDWR